MCLFRNEMQGELEVVVGRSDPSQNRLRHSGDIPATACVARIVNRPPERENTKLFPAERTSRTTGIAFKGVKLYQFGRVGGFYPVVRCGPNGGINAMFRATSRGWKTV